MSKGEDATALASAMDDAYNALLAELRVMHTFDDAGWQPECYL